MKTRAEVAAFIAEQLRDGPLDYDKHYKHHRHHYGRQELRELLDFIYGAPTNKAEELNEDGGIKPSKG